MKVAVYGTLKHGFSNNHILENSVFVRTATLRGYEMIDLCWFPGVKRTCIMECTIDVEIYDVDEKTLERMDALEGYNVFDPEKSMYVRAIDYSTGEPIWVYLYNRDTAGCKTVVGGRWNRRLSR